MVVTLGRSADEPVLVSYKAASALGVTATSSPSTSAKTSYPVTKSSSTTRPSSKTSTSKPNSSSARSSDTPVCSSVPYRSNVRAPPNYDAFTQPVVKTSDGRPWTPPPYRFHLGLWHVVASGSPIQVSGVWNFQHAIYDVFPTSSTYKLLNTSASAFDAIPDSLRPTVSYTSWNSWNISDNVLGTEYGFDTPRDGQAFVFDYAAAGRWHTRNSWSVVAWGYDANATQYAFVYQSTYPLPDPAKIYAGGDPAHFELWSRSPYRPDDGLVSYLVESTRRLQLPALSDEQINGLEITGINRNVIENLVIPSRGGYDGRRDGKGTPTCDRGCQKNAVLADCLDWEAGLIENPDFAVCPPAFSQHIETID